LVAEYRIAGRSDVKQEMHKIKENIGRRDEIAIKK
jgi:hypothetical protein